MPTPVGTVPRVTNDLRVGGTYHARMEARDGTYGFDLEATYDEVVDHEKITYTLTDGRKVITTFTEKGGKTDVTIAFDVEKDNSAEAQQQRWQAILNNFRDYVEKE